MLNRDLSNYDVTVKVCDFKTPSKSAGKIIDGSYMIAHVISDDRWQKKLRDGHVLGLFTHKGRQPREQINEIPYEDNMAISPYLCNVTKDVWVDNNELYAGINIFKDMEYGKLLMDMLSKGINVPVSMSVKAHADSNKYYVDDLLGVDFTFRPDLAAEVINVNFSENSEGGGVYHFAFVPEEKDIQVNTERLSKVVNNVQNKELKKNESDGSTIINFRESVFTKLKNKIDNHRANKELDANEDVYEVFIKPDKLKDLDALKIKYSKDNKLTNGYVAIRIKNLSNLTDEQLNFIQENDSSFCESPVGSSLNELKEIVKPDDGITRHTIMDYINDTDVKDFSSLFDSYPTELMNFSLIQYLQELRLAPHQVLRRRINEVIRMMNSKKQDWVIEKSALMKSYIDTYVLKWIQDILNNPAEKFNIIIGLRLSSYNIPRNDLMDLQRVLNRTKTHLLSTSIMPPQLQKEVNHKFQSVMNKLFDYINSQCITSGNHLV